MAHVQEDKEGMSELACTYAALILADDDIPVTADKIATILKAAGVNFVEPFWPNMFARALENHDLKQMLFNSGVGAGGPGAVANESGAVGAGAPAAAAAAATAAAPEKKEEKKPEPESESEDDDMGLDLFG